MKRFMLAIGGALLVPAASAAVITVPSPGFPTIQSALNVAAAGDTVRILAGTWFETIDVPMAAVGLTIQGKGEVILDARPGGVASGDGISVAAPQVTIERLTVRHASAAGITGMNADGLVVRNVRVLNCDGAGISVDGDDVSVVDCVVSGNVRGIRLSGARALVQRTTCSGSTIVAIELLGDHASVRRSTVSRSAEGIVASGANADLRRNVVLDVDARGIVASGDDAAVARNQVEGAGSHGIVLEGDRAAATRNQVRQASGAGFEVLAADCALDRNVISTTLLPAVRSSGSAAVVRANEIADAFGGAIATTGADTVIERNRIVRAAVHGIQSTGNGTVASDNVIADGTSGPGIAMVGALDAKVFENDVRDTPASAILLSSCNNGVVNGNRIRRAGTRIGGGLVLLNTSNTAASGNDVRFCPGDGIRSIGNVNTMSANRCRGNLDDGIHIVAGGVCQLNSNDVRNNLGEGMQNDGVDTFVINNVGKGNRIDFANGGTLSGFLFNDFGTGGATTPPEID